MTLVKTEAPFWGGVEVACCYTSLGHALLPKVVHFRALSFNCAGTTPLGFALLFPIVNVHLLSNIGINRTFKQTTEVLWIY